MNMRETDSGRGLDDLRPSSSPPDRERPVQAGPPARGGSPWRWPLLMAALVAVATVALAAGYSRQYGGRIFPGVRVGEVDLGGRSPSEALALLESSALAPSIPVTIALGDETTALSPEALGVTFDSRQSTADAYAVGRRSSRGMNLAEAAWVRLAGASLTPVLHLDEAKLAAAVDALAKSYDRPAVDSALSVNGTAVEATTASSGRYLNVTASVAAIRELASHRRWPLGTLSLPVGAIEPSVTDASPALGAATALLQAPISLTFGAEGWWLRPPDLATMLRPYNDGRQVRLGLDLERLASWLDPVTQTVSRTAEMPLFHFDEARGELELVQPGRPGVTLNLTPTAELILANGGGSERVVPISVTAAQPSIPDTVTAAELGIRELVRRETSRFVGSPPERIQNIGVAARRFDGRLIAPGATFSFNETIGDIDEKTGYVKTKVIMDGTTALGVGGGVCQVSTTLFRAAFWLGLPIVERQAHGYRVAYYEQGAPVGLDATVYSPSVDLKFVNDTSTWLLIETSTNPRAATLTFSLYGTKNERQVKLEGPRVLGETDPPPPREELDPTLAPGETHQVEVARKGASVTLSRIVVDGGVERRDTFASRYRPTGVIIAHGPQPPEQPVAADELPAANDQG